MTGKEIAKYLEYASDKIPLVVIRKEEYWRLKKIERHYKFLKATIKKMNEELN